MKQNTKQHFFINTLKNGLQNRKKGYTESKGISDHFGLGGTMFKKLLSFFAVVLIGGMLLSSFESVASIWSGGQMIGTGQPGVDGAGEALNRAGAELAGCRERCPCEDKINKDGLFYKNMVDYTEENTDACWFCDIFKELFDAINNVATTVFDNLGQSFLFLMGLGLLFLILFKVGKMVVQLQEVDVMQFLNDLFKPLGRGIIAMALLLGVTAQSDNIFSMLTTPVFEVSAKMGVAVMDTALPNNVEYIQSGVDGQSFSYKAGECNKIDTTKKEGKGVFTEGQRELLVCWLKQVSSSFITGIAIGGTLMDSGTEGTNFFTGGFSMTVVGFVIWGCFYLIYLFFPFKVVDAFVRMAFVLTLMPLWIILWVFPATVGYTKKAWEMFLSSCLLLVILSIMISFAVILMSKSIPEADRNGLLKCLRAGNDKLAVTWVLLGSGAILNTIAFAAMSWTLIGTASTLANSFVGGGGDLGIGAGMAALSARTVGAAWTATKNTAKAGLWGATALGGLAAAAGRRAGGTGGSGSGGGGAGGASIGASLGQFGGDTGRSGGSGLGGETGEGGSSFDRLNPSAQSHVQENVNNTVGAMRNAFMSGSSTGRGNGIKDNMALQAMLMGATSPAQRAAMQRVMESMEKGATGRGANRRAGQPDKKSLEHLREVYAQEMLARDPSAGQRTGAAEAQGGQTEETNRKVQRQEEAIQKLRENPEGMRAVYDTAANMSFIQEQIQSSSNVSELEEKLKNHNWQYSGNDTNLHNFHMKTAAIEMMEAKQNNDPQKMESAIREVLQGGLGQARINDTDAIVERVMQKSLGDPALISTMLNNLTKKE